MDDGLTWKIRVAAPAVEGRANDALIAFLAKTLNVPRTCVSLTAGGSSRSKRVRVEGVTMEEAAARLTGAGKM